MENLFDFKKSTIESAVSGLFQLGFYRNTIFVLATMMGEPDPDLTLSLLNIHEPQVNNIVLLPFSFVLFSYFVLA